MIDVTVKVPEGRLGELYAMVGHWHSEERPRTGTVDAPATEPSTRKNWADSNGDLALAQVVWTRFSARFKAALSYLIDRPQEKVPGEALAQASNIPHGKAGLAGALGWPGRICAAVGRADPWQWELEDDGSSVYWVEREVAELFKKVRDS